MKQKKKMHWAIVLLAEVLLLGIAAALVSLAEWLSVGVSTVCQWLLYPLCAAAIACIATRKGVNNYAAWLPAPVMYPLVYWLVWNYLPSAGPMFLSALTGVVGAALGETMNQFEGRRRR